MFKRLSCAVLSVLILCAFSLNTMAASNTTVKLDTVFQEAKNSYEALARTKTRSSGEIQAPYYKEIEQVDGTILVVEGYPTDYSNNTTSLNENQFEDNIVYSLESITYDEYSFTRTKTWGYLFTSLIWQNDDVNEKRRIDCFSYILNLNNGYELENMSVRYFSFDATSDLSAEHTINTTSLTMTNYPTSRLGWVTTAVTAVEAQINTGVEYTVDLGSITYKLVHNLVPWGWEEI